MKGETAQFGAPLAPVSVRVAEFRGHAFGRRMGHPGYATIAFESMDYLPGVDCFILGHIGTGKRVGNKEKTLCLFSENVEIRQFADANRAGLACIKCN
jgi:hypothetical protein